MKHHPYKPAGLYHTPSALMRVCAFVCEGLAILCTLGCATCAALMLGAAAVLLMPGVFRAIEPDTLGAGAFVAIYAVGAALFAGVSRLTADLSEWLTENE